MGQYYKPVSLTKKEFITSWDYNCGAKLMEHSYIGNDLTLAVENLLSEDGPWHKTSIVWAGDYAPAEKNPHIKNIFSLCDEEDSGETGFKKIYRQKTEKSFRYLINHTKKLVLDLSFVKADKDGYKIHPLPLLTAEGNGNGGGDFEGVSPKGLDVGSWARDILSVSDILPNEVETEMWPIYQGVTFTEI
jgi:hypothetical protein